MNISAYIFYLLFLYNPHVDGDPKKVISCHIDNVTFEEFCDTIYSKSHVIVYYDVEWVQDIKVSMHIDSIPVDSAVILALDGTALQVSIWNNQLILLPNEKLIETIPKYQSNVFNNNIDVGDKEITESEERYIQGRKEIVLQTLQVGEKGALKNSQFAKIRGQLTDIESGEPIIGGSIYIEETQLGKTTDQNGYYNLAISPGKYHVSFECLGYEKAKYFIEVLSDGELNIELDKKVTPLEEVIVHGDRQMDIRSSDPGLVKIPIKSIKEIPTMMGERDILKISEMLPGIVSVGEGSSGLNVRGGNSDQNAFYINKIPIYNTSHMFGFFPAFNSDIIKDFSIFKGHVPAQYGGRLSSVFNIITRQGNRKKFGFHGALSPVTASVTLEGPIKKEVCTFLVSARASYSDWILSRIQDPLIMNSSANFSDFAASINYDLEKTNLSAFVYNSNDFFQLTDINSYKYSNIGASINIRHDFSPSLQGDFSLIRSQYGFETTDQKYASTAYRHNYNIEHYELRGDFDYILNEKNTLSFGTSLLYYNLNRGNIVPYGIESLRIPLQLGKEQGFESALYISDTYNVFSQLDFTLGLRYSLYAPMGPKKVNTYQKDEPVDERYVLDSLFFDSGQPIKWYSQPEVRAVLNFETDAQGSLKLAFNQMHQNLFMLSNTISVAPNTQWKLSDYHIKPSSSDQLSFGVFRNFRNGGWESSVELFYKKTNNYTEFKDGADFLSSPDVETLVLQGDQQAYGLEFFLKRSRRKLEGWISYTYSRSFVTVNGQNEWSKINYGEMYPSNYDIPHALNGVINYHINRRITASSVITYQTGKPITYPVAVYYVDDIVYTDYSKRNEYRIPDYFRIDISLSIEGNLKKNKLIHSSWMFGVYNLTGRKNPYSVYFELKNGKIDSYKYSVIGVPFITISWLFKFGNYASD